MLLIHYIKMKASTSVWIPNYRLFLWQRRGDSTYPVGIWEYYIRVISVIDIQRKSVVSKWLKCAMHYVGSRVPAAVLFHDRYLVKNKMVFVKNTISYCARLWECERVACCVFQPLPHFFTHFLCFVLAPQPQKVERKPFRNKSFGGGHRSQVAEHLSSMQKHIVHHQRSIRQTSLSLPRWLEKKPWVRTLCPVCILCLCLKFNSLGPENQGIEAKILKWF